VISEIVSDQPWLDLVYVVLKQSAEFLDALAGELVHLAVNASLSSPDEDEVFVRDCDHGVCTRSDVNDPNLLLRIFVILELNRLVQIWMHEVV